MKKFFYNSVDPKDTIKIRLWYIIIGLSSIVDGLVNVCTLGFYGTMFSFHSTVAMTRARLDIKS